MITAIVKGLIAVGTKLLIASCSEKVIEWGFFYIAEAIAKSTKTPHDDAFLLQIKDAYAVKNKDTQ